MKNIIIYIIVVLSFFFFVDSVSAASAVDGLQVPSIMKFYNNTGSYSFSELDTVMLDAGVIGNGYVFNSNLTTIGNGYGLSESFCGLGFLAGNYYTVTLYNFDIRGYYLHPWYTIYSSAIGIGNSYYEAMSSVNVNSGNVNSSQNYVDIGTGMLGSVSYTFKAEIDASCFRGSLGTQQTITWEPGDLYFLGYTVISHGSKAPTTTEIQQALQSEFNSINNNINEMQNSINSNIDEMKDKQDQTNQTLDEIKDMDISDEDKELPDDTDFNDYQDAEDDLMDKVSEADMSVIDIAIDEDSSIFVWDTLTDLIQSHTLIFSTIIAILSIGIIKLALGR